MTTEVCPARGGNQVWGPAEMLVYLRTNVRIDEDGCALWVGALATHRTPKVMWGNKLWMVRRLMCHLTNRPVSKNRVAYSSCGKLRCVGESCLRVGTRLQMCRSRAQLGIHVHGATHAVAVARGRAAKAALPMTERFAVRQMRLDGMTWAEIAQKYGVHKSTPFAQMKAWERLFGPAAFWVQREAA